MYAASHVSWAYQRCDVIVGVALRSDPIRSDSTGLPVASHFCAGEDGEWTGDAMDRKDSERSKQFPHLGAAFRTNVEQFGPNDFFVMQKCMKEVRASSHPDDSTR